MNTERLFGGVLIAMCLLGAGFGLIHSGLYGLTIFVVIPVLMGALPSVFRRPRSGAHAAGMGALTVAIGLGSLLILRLEGLICIAMAAPLALPLGALGGWLVWEMKRLRRRGEGLAMLAALPLMSLAWDVKAPPALFEVRSAIEIAAPPEAVWKHVVSFSDLPEPEEWFFRAGLAYPKRARIEGSGPGAVRYCEFSTGPFVEPIEVWNEPSLLRFRVTENPEPMHELSPYSISPKHLHGYLVSKQGQFQLTRLASGHTLLEGTTWYQHGLWPGEYWRWWSDAIIHRIHLRVLHHIRMLSEQG